jgi:hypothetical protein
VSPNEFQIIIRVIGAAAAKLGQHYMSTVIPPATPGASPTNDSNTIEYEKVNIAVDLLYNQLITSDSTNTSYL